MAVTLCCGRQSGDRFGVNPNTVQLIDEALTPQCRRKEDPTIDALEPTP